MIKDNVNQDNLFSNYQSSFKFSYNPKSPKIQSMLKPSETFKFMNIEDNDSYEISVEGIRPLKKVLMQ